MWPFRRKVEALAAEGPRPVPAPVIRRDWAGLPPIQRFVGAHPLTAPSDEFSDDLATHQDPSVTTDTMGHQVSADAPAGLVLALVRPTTRSDGPAMIPRPRVQRSAAGAVAESGEWDGDEAAPDLARPSPLPMSAHAVTARELAVVAPEPAIQRLTSLAPDVAPTPIAPVAQRSRTVPTPLTPANPSDEPAEMPPAPAPRLTLGQSRRLGLGAPIRQVPDHSVQRAENPRPTLAERGKEFEPLDTSREALAAMDLPPVQRARIDLPFVEAPPDHQPLVGEPRMPVPSVTTASSPEASDASRLDLPLAHRRAPDEPFAASRPLIPPTAQLSAISPTEPAGDSPRAAASAVQRLADSSPPVPSSTTNPTPSTLLTAATAAVSRSSLPLMPESSARVPTISATPAPDTTMAPLVGHRPLRPSGALQRAASTDVLTPTLPHRGRENPLADSDPTLIVPERGTVNAASTLQRASEDAPHPGTPPHGVRELPLTWASEGPPTLTLPQRERENHATILQRGRENRATPTLTLPQWGRDDRAAQELPLAPSHAVAVQRATSPADESETEATGIGKEALMPTVQGVWYESRVGVSRIGEGVAASESMAPVAAPAGLPQASETEMDELARKLYDRIRGRLKTELLVDRERAGFLTDLR